MGFKIVNNKLINEYTNFIISNKIIFFACYLKKVKYTFKYILNPSILPLLSGRDHFNVKTVPSSPNSATTISGECRGTVKVKHRSHL